MFERMIEAVTREMEALRRGILRGVRVVWERAREAALLFRSCSSAVGLQQFCGGV
jgi:hypothetical protein